MNSCIYKGWVSHRRMAPTSNCFRYRLFMLYIDLAELPRLFDGIPLWSAKRAALAWFKRSDYRADTPLDSPALLRLLHESGELLLLLRRQRAKTRDHRG